MPPATLKEIGLDSRRLSEWRKLAKRGSRFCLQLIDEILAEDREPTYAEVLRGGNVGQHALKAFSGNNEYYTPARFIEAALRCGRQSGQRRAARPERGGQISLRPEVLRGCRGDRSSPGGGGRAQGGRAEGQPERGQGRRKTICHHWWHIVSGVAQPQHGLHRC
jgi:hypothetical protein